MRNLSFKPGWVLSLIPMLWLVVSPIHTVWAQEDLERPPPIPPESSEDVPIPPKIQQEQLEPTVTIREEEGNRIEEYRQDGQVYMVKVTPKNGIPYYYMDNDGDGRLELDVNSRIPDPVQPVYWKVKEWK